MLGSPNFLPPKMPPSISLQWSPPDCIQLSLGAFELTLPAPGPPVPPGRSKYPESTPLQKQEQKHGLVKQLYGLL